MAATNSQISDSDVVPLHRALKGEIVVAGIPQYVIADRVGLTEEYFSKVLRGRKPLTPELATAIREAIAKGAAA